MLAKRGLVQSNLLDTDAEGTDQYVCIVKGPSTAGAALVVTIASL